MTDNFNQVFVSYSKVISSYGNRRSRKFAAIFSAEAEYVALTKATREAFDLRYALLL